MTVDESGSDTRVRGLMAQMLSAVGALPAHEVYFSTPITTGQTFLQWRRQTRDTLPKGHPDYDALHRTNVIIKNIERVRPVVADLRRRYATQLVINPSELAPISGWEQNDYHNLWCEVLTQYAEKAIFADGWQYSDGCALEFAAAVGAGILTLNEDLRPITSAQGVRFMADALREMTAVGAATPLLRQAMELAMRSMAPEADGTGSYAER